MARDGADDVAPARDLPGSHAYDAIARANPRVIGRRAANDVIDNDTANVYVLGHRYPEPAPLA
jgi:hypothetical protein